MIVAQNHSRWSLNQETFTATHARPYKHDLVLGNVLGRHVLGRQTSLVPCQCTEDFTFLKLFYSNEIQNIEVKSSVVGLFEFRVENSFLIIHVSIRLVTYF